MQARKQAPDLLDHNPLKPVETIRKRLDRAETLLLQTEMPVTEICHAVGFESLGSFSDLFRQRAGASPQKFRMAKRFEDSPSTLGCEPRIRSR